MHMRILQICLIVFVILLSNIFIGCAEKKIVYVDRVVKVNIPQPCYVPKVNCNFNKETYTEIITELYLCVLRHEEAAKVCQPLNELLEGNVNE